MAYIESCLYLSYSIRQYVMNRFAELCFTTYFRSFTAADTDYDGQVSFEEFHHMIEAAGALPR